MRTLTRKEIIDLKREQDDRSFDQRLAYAQEAMLTLDSIAAISVREGKHFHHVARELDIVLVRVVQELEV